MAQSINKVTLIGNLGRDPEIRHSSDGHLIVYLSVATNESWKDKSTGERKDRTEWHRVVIFNDRLGVIAEKYLKKGSKIFLEGQIKTRKIQENDIERSITEIVLPKFKGELMLLDNQSDSTISNDSKSTGNYKSSNTNLSEELDDEIPF